MSTYLKYKPAWLQLLIFGALTFGIFMALGFASIVLVSKLYHISWMDLTTMDLTNPVILEAAKTFQGVTSLCLFGAPSLVFAYLSDPRPMPYIGFKQPVPKQFFILALLLIIAALPMVSWLAELNQRMHLPASMSDVEKAMRSAEDATNDMLRKFLDMKSGKDLVIMLIVLALIPAVVEELFFRGVLQRIFIQTTKNAWAGIIITAIIFSAIHGQAYGFIPRMVLGALLGALYWYSGSLWPGIIAHFVNNAFQIVLVYKFGQAIDEEPHFGVWMIALSCFAVVIITWWMRRISHTHYAEVYDVDDHLILPPDQK